MSDIYDEFHAGVSLIMDAYRDLQKLNPNNELLTLIEVDEEGFTVTKEEEFNRRYWTTVERKGFFSDKKDEHLTNMYSMVATNCRYERELESAVKEELRKRLEQNQPLEIGNRVRCYL